MAITKLNPYLNFNGTAEKAIKLYESALGRGTVATVKLPIHSPVKVDHAARAAR